MIPGRPGNNVTVTVVRNGQQTDVAVGLGERPQQR
jgi:S1-C subfamily serine protease